MQDCRHDRVSIEAQLGEDFRGRDRMTDVGLTAEALLTLVGCGAELGRLADSLDLIGRQVLVCRRQ